MAEIFTLNGYELMDKKAREQLKKIEDELETDDSGDMSLPTNDDGSVNHGAAGQFLISNGDGSVSWASLDVAEGGGY